MITIFLLFGGIFLIGKVIPFIFRVLFALISFFFEIISLMFMFVTAGVVGVILFFAIDLCVLTLIRKIIF